MIKKLFKLIALTALFSGISASELPLLGDQELVLPKVAILKLADGTKLPFKRNEYKHMQAVVEMLQDPGMIGSENEKPEILLKETIVSPRAGKLLARLMDGTVLEKDYLSKTQQEQRSIINNLLYYLTDEKKLINFSDKAFLLHELYKAVNFLNVRLIGDINKTDTVLLKLIAQDLAVVLAQPEMNRDDIDTIHEAIKGDFLLYNEVKDALKELNSEYLLIPSVVRLMFEDGKTIVLKQYELDAMPMLGVMLNVSESMAVEDEVLPVIYLRNSTVSFVTFQCLLDVMSNTIFAGTRRNDDLFASFYDSHKMNNIQKIYALYEFYKAIDFLEVNLYPKQPNGRHDTLQVVVNALVKELIALNKEINREASLNEVCSLIKNHEKLRLKILDGLNHEQQIPVKSIIENGISLGYEISTDIQRTAIKRGFISQLKAMLTAE